MAILHRKEDIDRYLATAPVRGKHLLEPLKSLAESLGGSLKILEDAYVSDNEAEVHDTERDIWLCLEGQPTFVHGGELVRPRQVGDGEWKAKEIKGGTTLVLQPGDWLEIPAFEPHQHNCPDGVARMVIIKVPVKK